MKPLARLLSASFAVSSQFYGGLLGLCLVSPVLVPTAGWAGEPLSQTEHLASAGELEQQGKALFDQRQFVEAATVLERAASLYEAQGDRTAQAIALSNLALTYGQLGQWSQANTAATTSLSLLQEAGSSSLVLAQVFNVQGQLQLAQGQTQAALMTWERSEALFKAGQDAAGVTRSRINQAQALQSLGLYRRAIALLTDITKTLSEQPPSPEQAVALRSLGDALRIGGELEQSRQVLEQSLAIAQQLQQPTDIAATELSLGNTLHALGGQAPSQSERDARIQAKIYQQAQDYYARAATSDAGLIPIQAQLNQLPQLLEAEQWSVAAALGSQIQAALKEQPLSRSTLYATLNLANRWIELRRLSPTPAPPAREIAELLAKTKQQAEALGDSQAQSYAIGILGTLYEQEQQWSEAEELTRKALVLTQALPENKFRWQWQLGRLLKVKGDRKGAITAYTSAVETLQTLRQDLVAINPDVQFSFRESVEPIYRQLVALLLDAEAEAPRVANLKAARLTIESLQLAELDNFFREACLDANPTLIDELDTQAAVIYPIILPERLAVIVSFPGQDLKLYTTEIAQTEVEQLVEQFDRALRQRNSTRVQSFAQSMYNLLLRPIAIDLAKSNVKTLVFVQDGVLRNIPMAALHDGSEYLIAQYAVAVTPGLQLVRPTAAPSRRQTVLAAGISKAQPPDWSPLPGVVEEIENIERHFKSRSILDETFTRDEFQNALNQGTYPIVHLATHGQFSSQPDQTFLVAWNEKINVNQLQGVLQTNELQQGGIELLVLSACQTAQGDKRAALGLAGIAARSGARSTVAALWHVDDAATAIFMEKFYKILASGNISKAAALQQAQQSMLRDFEDYPEDLKKPYFWAAYILIGNWL